MMKCSSGCVEINDTINAPTWKLLYYIENKSTKYFTLIM